MADRGSFPQDSSDKGSSVDGGKVKMRVSLDNVMTTVRIIDLCGSCPIQI